MIPNLTPVAQRYVLALRASPLTLQIVAMLKKKLGPRLDHEREDVGSLVESVLSHRDLNPILDNYLHKATHGEYILDRINSSFKVEYTKGILTFVVTVLGETFQWNDKGEDSGDGDNEAQVYNLWDSSKAEKVLEHAMGAKLTNVGKNNNFKRDPGDYDTYMKYEFKVSLPMPTDLFFSLPLQSRLQYPPRFFPGGG